MDLKKTLLLTAVLVAGSLSACSGESTPPNPAITSSATQPTISATPSGPPAADLTKLTMQKLTGTAPKQLPVWKPGGNPQEYIVQTLRYLVAAANKAGVTVPPVNYAIYNGDKKLTISCSGNTTTDVVASETYAALYCKEVGGLLLVPSDWQQADPWDTAATDKLGWHPLHYIIDALAINIDPAKLAYSEQHCYEGKLYAGITLTQPDLGKRVAGYLAPSGKMEYHPTEEWRNSAYGRTVAGISEPC